MLSQLGGTLTRNLSLVRHANPRFGPTRASKHDVKDGFYRMQLDPICTNEDKESLMSYKVWKCD